MAHHVKDASPSLVLLLKYAVSSCPPKIRRYFKVDLKKSFTQNDFFNRM